MLVVNEMTLRGATLPKKAASSPLIHALDELSLEM